MQRAAQSRSRQNGVVLLRGLYFAATDGPGFIRKIVKTSAARLRLKAAHAKNARNSTASCRTDKWTKCGDFEVSSEAAGDESGQRGYCRSAGGSSSLHVTSCSAIKCTGYSARKQTSTRSQRLQALCIGPRNCRGANWANGGSEATWQNELRVPPCPGRGIAHDSPPTHADAMRS